MSRHFSKGSVLIGSVILILIAALSVAFWLAFVAGSARAAERDRSRMHAMYAAEAGIEQVIEYFNHPERYLGEIPEAYDDFSTHPLTLPLLHAVNPDYYELFEPYITAYAQNADGLPIDALSRIIWNTQTNSLIEGGVPQVLGVSYFAQRNGTPAQVSLTSKIPSFTVDISDLDHLTFLGRRGEMEAEVVSIEIIHPSAFTADELAAATVDGPVICKVVSTGRASNGVVMRIESMLGQNIGPSISSPAAIISESTVAFDGNFEVYWGEVWANSSIELGNETWLKLPRLGDAYRRGTGANPTIDPWFRMRSTGYMYQRDRFADGRDDTGFGPTMLTEAANGVLYRSPFDRSIRPTDLRPNQAWVHDGRDNILQHQNLNFPTYDYSQWKNFFMMFGLPYYFTDTNGNVYGTDRDPASVTYGQVVSKSFDAWFASNPSDLDTYWKWENQFAFIDSVPVDDNGVPAPFVDGVPLINDTYYPRSPTSPAHRFADVMISGSSTHTRGVMFAAANLKATGTGNPPRASALVEDDGETPVVLRPDGVAPRNRDDFRIFHNGFLYSWGQIDFGGNRSVYGSVYAVQGYGAAGTPTVYYNSRLRDGSYFNLNQSRVRRMMWNLNPPVIAGAG